MLTDYYQLSSLSVVDIPSLLAYVMPHYLPIAGKLHVHLLLNNCHHLTLHHVHCIPIAADTVPKNHYKENWKRIKQIQFQSKKKQEAQKPLPVHQKSIKYDKIPPKVTVCMQVC